MGTTSSPRSIARHLAIVACLVAVAPAIVGAESTVVSTDGDAVATARGARQDAERQVADLVARRTALTSTIGAKAGATAEIVDALARARRDVRQNAIEAYIAGGESDRLSAILGADDIVEAADRVNFLGSRTLNALDASARYEQLKRDNDPENLALATRLDALDVRLADARDALYQATANEADAERSAALEAAAARSAKRAAATTTSAPSATDAPGTTSAPSTTQAPGTTTTAPLAPGSFVAPASYHPVPGVGPSAEAWAHLRACESGGNYRSVSGSGRYRGAYQFDQQTWENLGGIGDPATAPPADQDLAAAVLLSIRGARAWPSCGAGLF